MAAIHADMTEITERPGASLVESRPWLTRAKTTVAVAIVLGAASLSLAKDSGPPAIDIDNLCRGALTAMREVFISSDLQSMDTCVADEQAARGQLVQKWASYPVRVKTMCVRPHEYLPGYVEWQTCIEITLDALGSRNREAAAAGAVGSGVSRRPSHHRTGPPSADPPRRECPVVKYTEDGGVDSVINCRPKPREPERAARSTH